MTTPEVTLSELLTIAKRHGGCSELQCNVYTAGESSAAYTLDECLANDHRRPLIAIILAVRKEVAGFDRCIDFNELYTRLRDIHCLLNEPEEES